MSITSIASNTSARVAAGVLGIAMALSLSFGAVIAPVHAQDASVIAALQAQIAALQAQLSAMAGGSGSQQMGGLMCPAGGFSQNLTIGSTGSEVMALQKFLNSIDGTQLGTTGAGSPGNETSTFGPITRTAVTKYQQKYGITPIAGYWGSISRAKAASLCAAAPTTPGPTPSAGTGLMVSAAAQPANALAVPGSSRVPFTKFTLTAGNDGDVTVNNVTVARTGVINKVVFDGVVLLDEAGNIIGSAKTLNSNDQALIGATMTVPRGTSKTFTVAGNMAALSTMSSHAGEVGGLQVVAVNTTATVTGSLPIVGASHTVNGTLVIGSMTGVTSSFDPSSSQTQPIGTTGQRFAGIQMTAGSGEDVRVRSIRWYQTGSAGAGDLGNLVINANGTDYPATVSADGKYYSANFGSGLVVAKGFAIDIYIKGDIVGTGAAGRTVKFNLDKTTDLYVTGEKYGYGITPTASSASDSGASDSISGFVSTSSSASPWFDGSLITISAGSVTSVSKANEVAAQNVAINVQNQPLGGFATDFKGEPITVQQIVMTTSTSTASIGGVLTNVTIVNENGSVVAGPIDATGSGTTQTLTFTDSITFPVGRHVYTVKGKLSSTASNGAVLNLLMTVNSTNWVNAKGDTSGNTVSLPGNSITMNAVTVKGAALAITVSGTPSAQSVVAGSQGFLFANYQLDATQSGEDVRFSSIPLLLTIGSGAYTDLTNCKLYDGANALNTGSNVINPTVAHAGAETFTFDQSLTIAKGTVKTLAMKCDVSTGASSTYKWGIAASPAITVTGVTSNVGVDETVTASTGSLMSVNTGALVASADSSAPSYKVVPAGSTDVVMNAIKFRPSNESQTLRRIGLKLTNSASSSASDLVMVKLYVGTTQIGQATFTGANTNATSTNVTGSGEMNYVLPADTDTVVTVKADLANIGTNQPAVSGHLIKIDVDTNGTNTQATGVGSGATINASGSTSVAGARIFKSVPTMTYSTTGGSGALTNGVNDLLSLSVTADAKGEVQLNKLTFTIATTTVTIATPTFSGPSGNVASSTNVNFTNGNAAITVYFDSTTNTADRVIAAGQTKTYTLRGTITGLTGSNSGSVSTALTADTSYPSLAGFMAATSSLTSSKTIWSPSSTTTANNGSDFDWTNGYGLGGCFATSGIGNDCTARVMTN